MIFSRIVRSIGILAVAALCRCSLAVDLNGLDDFEGGGPADAAGADAPGADAAADASSGDGSAGADASVEHQGDAHPEATSDWESGRTPEGASEADGKVGPDSNSPDGASGPDAAIDADAATGNDSAPAPDSGDVTEGLVAYYPFDETSGTSAADTSGNGNAATLVGGAGWAPGYVGGAVSLDGMSGYVRLPNGLLSGATDFTVATWVKLNGIAAWARIFDFGTGTNTYMFLTCQISTGTGMRFAITSSGYYGEQVINGPAFTTGAWQHVAVTLAGGVGTLYVNGTAVATNASMTLNASSLGSTTQTWIGRSEYAGDPYAGGLWDEFRIYDRALNAAEVQTLAR